MRNPSTILAHIDRGSGLTPRWYRPVKAHAHRVVEVAEQIAIVYGLPEERRRELVIGARWHDIGKLGVSPAILDKPGPLTGSERAHIRRHPGLGLRFVRGLDLPPIARRVIYEHHERWDGLGYPARAAARAICVEAQIVSIADVYDAMTSDRPYRRALPAAVAIEYISAQREQMFAPDILDAALLVLPQRAALAAA